MNSKDIPAIVCFVFLAIGNTGCRKEACSASHQSIEVGDTLSLAYVRLNPAFEFVVGHNQTSSFDIDIDYDGLPDLQFYSTRNASQAGNSSSFSGLNILDNKLMVLVQTDSVTRLVYWSTNMLNAVVTTETSYLSIPSDADSFYFKQVPVMHPKVLGSGESSLPYLDGQFKDTLSIGIEWGSSFGMNYPVYATSRYSVSYSMPLDSVGYFFFKKETACGLVQGWIRMEEPNNSYVITGYAHSLVE